MERIHKVKQIDERTWHIDELRASMYLVAGKDSALLIDTAYGAGDITEIVRELTDLPYKVVITHAHPDHIGGIGWFNDVYIHLADLAAAAMTPDSKIKSTIESLIGSSPDKLHPLNPKIRFHSIKQGDTFDLGGRRLTVQELPGHSFGSIGLLDRENDMLFSGDACNPNQLLSLPKELWNILTPGSGFTSVQTFMDSLIKIYEMPATRIFTGHLNELGFEPASRQLTEDLLECCRRVLSDTSAYNTSSETEAENVFSTVSVGEGVLSYHPGHIEDDWIIG